jgi:MFS family permease
MKLRFAYKWEVLALLWWAFFNNQTDRQAFNVVLPLIREDLQVTDIQIGIIATSFNLVFALFVPLAGYLGDIVSRKWILTISILYWSTATMMTGLSTGFLLLILFRCSTSAGESFFGAPHAAMLGSYHKETRSTAFSILQTAYYSGMILAGFMAGYIGDRWGWRTVFYSFGAFGIINGLVMLFRLKDKKEDTGNKDVTLKNAEDFIGIEKVGFFDGFRVLFTTPSALFLAIAFSIFIFVLTGYLTWMPTYLYENFNMSLAQAGFHSMFYTHLFAFIGILFAGRFSDLSAKKDPSRRLLLQGMGLLVSAPFIFLMGNSMILPIIYFGFAGFGFGRAFFDANTYAILYDVIPEKYHSSVSGAMIMCGFGIGSLSPLFLAYMKSFFDLSFGITVLGIFWIIAAIILTVSFKYYFKKDYKKALQSQG